jgi:hypothetical protein
MADAKPRIYDLWKQAGGETPRFDRGRYMDLLHEHGILLRPGDEGYEAGSRTLPCGWDPGKSRAQQDRCEITELLTASCAHCTGRVGDEPAEHPERGPWFFARYPGECSGCAGAIVPDDTIAADGAGGWVCEECGSKEEHR